MRQEPPSQKRRVALAHVHVNVSTNVLAIAMDDVFMSECIVIIKPVVCPKFVGIDGDRLLLADHQ